MTHQGVSIKPGAFRGYVRVGRAQEESETGLGRWVEFF